MLPNAAFLVGYQLLPEGFMRDGPQTSAGRMVVAATVKFGVYQYRSWWRWSGEWKPTTVMNLRDVRLSVPEIVCLVIGILLIVFGAYRETLMAFNLL